MNKVYNIETDLGRDPDDLFTVLWLISQDVQINNLCITPGDCDQVAVAHFIREYLDLNFKIVTPLKYKNKRNGLLSSGGVHYELLKRYGRTTNKLPDDSINIVERNQKWLSIGPLTNILEFFYSPFYNYEMESEISIKNIDITIQGGFCPYSFYRPTVTLNKFENKTAIDTFNFNGDKNAALFAINNFKKAKFVGKNVCHTMEFTKDRLPKSANTKAGELFIDAAKLYFNKHDSKKFHDPLAAVLSINDSMGTWVYGSPFRLEGKWSTFINDTTQRVLVDVDRELFWEYIQNI